LLRHVRETLRCAGIEGSSVPRERLSARVAHRS
jgi:hypothetical protein